jgi:subtilisin family serine protease
VHRAGGSAEIPGRYIVVMKQRSDRSDRAAAQRAATGRGGKVTHEYSAALSGFAAELPAKAVEALRRNPNVDYIESDAEVKASGTQSSAPWGLDRVDQRSLPLNNEYTYDSTGAGVTAYIIDTGIRKAHRQFGGRVAAGFTAVKDGRGTNDCNGHGTHVAGTVGAKKFGVAKGVTLRPVRVLNCTGMGSNSKVIAGIDWVTQHHRPGTPAVANVSLGGPASLAIDQAVRASVDDGVTYAAAAGNEDRNACADSPARVETVLTVGSTTRSDARSWFSNRGACVDLFAPGTAIKSTWHSSNTATRTIDGTSMASPHVAGTAALMLQRQPAASPGVIAQSLLHATTPGVVSSVGTDSPNRLLFSRGLLSAPPASPAGDQVVNGGFEHGATWWSATPGVITAESGRPARTGTWRAWLNGFGQANTERLSQSMTVPATGTATLSFHLRVDTREEPDWAYDTLTVELISGGVTKQLKTYSNFDARNSYVRHSFDVGAFSGKSLTLRFTGTEDSSVPTHFLIDDVVLATG